MSSKDDDPFIMLDTRMRAFLESNSFLLKTSKQIIRNTHLSALAMSKFLMVLYIGTFLVIYTSNEQVVLITGGKGPVFWAMLIFLVCVVIESKRYLKLNIFRSAEDWFDDAFKEIDTISSGLDEQGKKDFYFF